MSKFKNSQAGSFLYNLGVSYHNYGEIRSGKIRLFDYYETDGVTEKQKQSIVAACPDAQFKRIGKQYAPEITKIAICFPKAAFYRQIKKG